MRVLLMHNDHASKGGASEVLDHERDLLAAAGHDTQVFLLPSAEEQGLSSLRAGARAVWNREATRETARLIAEFRPDVVHVHTPFPLMSPAVFRTAAQLGVPSVATLHSFRYSCIVGTCYRNGSICEDCVGSRLKLAGVRHRCYHGSLPGSVALTSSLAIHRGIGTFEDCINRFLALTPFAKGLLVRDGVPAQKIEVKANSVDDPGPITSRGDDPYIAFAARLVDVKGVRTLLEAWRHVAPGLRLVIAGDGDLRHLVEAHAMEDPSIEFRGWIDQTDMARFFGQARCVVVPSEWYEAGVPLVSLRAMSVGTPVISSDLQNLSEDVVSDGAGTTFATGDPLSLAAELTSVLREPAVWAQRGLAARTSYFNRYTPEATIRALELVYREVVKEGAGSSRKWSALRP